MNQAPGRVKWWFLLFSLPFLALVTCVTSITAVPSTTEPAAMPPAAESPFVLPAPLGPVVAPGQVGELVPGGAIDWSGKTVWARGAGVLDPGNSNRDLAWQMAQRAATVVAQRNLLEIVKGIRVDSDTRVQQLVSEHDSAYQRVEAIVKGARQRSPARFDSVGGTVEVELECDLYGEAGVEGALLPSPVAGPPTANVSAGELSNQAREFLRQYSTLVLDAGNTGLKPSLFPRLYNVSGSLLLDTRELTYADATRGCAVQYVGTLDQFLNRPDFGQPMVFRVREARGKLGTDIVLAGADADMLRKMADGLEFLVGAGRVLVKLAF